MSNLDGKPVHSRSEDQDRREAGDAIDSRLGVKLPDRIRGYLNAIVQGQASAAGPLTSVILFGSTAKGAFAYGTSDVDLFLVISDDATPERRCLVHEAVRRIEIEHGFRLPTNRAKNSIERFAERAGGQEMSSFLCTRSDLLSGDVARIFHLRPVEKIFVDRVVLASVITSAVTIWGEELLPRIPMLSIRRFDVFKALFSFAGVVILSAVAFPALPEATKYAMDALKHSLHSCYFCYFLGASSLEEEVAFFHARLRQSATLRDLLSQRRNCKRSFRFVLRCLPMLFRLHLRTAWDNYFPRAVVWSPKKSQAAS